MPEIPRCPKCAAPLPEWMIDFEDDPKYIARTHASDGGCIYVPCDDLACRAKRAPVTLEEYKAAYEHYRRHEYLGGCSHGR